MKLPARVVGPLAWAGAAGLMISAVIAGKAAVGQEAKSAQTAKAKPQAEAPAEAPVPEKSTPAKKRTFRGRLPAYYRQVVDEKQREKIYEIQREYAPKVDALRAQLAALIAERDEKVAAVLTPEQIEKVEQLRAEARAKRSSSRPPQTEAASGSSTE